MKIWQKLFLAHFTMLIFTFLVIVVVEFQLNEVGNKFTYYETHRFKQLNTLQNIRFSGMRIVSSTSEFLFLFNTTNTGGEDELEQIKQGTNNFWINFQSYASAIDEISSNRDEKSYRNQLKELGEAVIELSEKLIKAALDFETPAALYELKEKFEDAETEFIKSISEKIALENNAIKKDVLDLTKYIQFTEVKIEVGLLILVTIIFGLGYWVSRSISQPIAVLANATKQLIAGDYSVQTLKDVGGEIGNLGHSFRHMAKEIKVQHTALEHEISERRSTEIQLKQAREDADAANLAKSEFLANMSHDLRTPLNAIMGFSDMMRIQAFGPLGDSHYEEYANDIHFSGSLLLSLVDDILDLAKIEAGKYELTEETLDVSSLIRDCFRMSLNMAKEANVKIDTAIPKNMPALRGDRIVLVQMLNNFLSNAIKFTPSGGNIRVLAKVNADDEIIIKVTDTGLGMSEEGLKTAINPYEQGSAHSRRVKGTGLGLYICVNFMKLFKGTLHIESELTIGTTVSIKFPSERTLHTSPAL